MLRLRTSGSFDNTTKFLKRMSTPKRYGDLNRYGEKGVAALAAATPKASGETANSWAYRIVEQRGRVRIEWYNKNVIDGQVIAVLIQYGHGTGTGGWVQGRDYINPAMRPIFDEIVAGVWKEVKG